MRERLGERKPKSDHKKGCDRSMGAAGLDCVLPTAIISPLVVSFPCWQFVWLRWQSLTPARPLLRRLLFALRSLAHRSARHVQAPSPSQPLNLFLNALLTAPLHFYPARDGRLFADPHSLRIPLPPLPADSSLVLTSFFGQRSSQPPFLSPPPDLILPSLQACSTIQTSPRLARRQSR